MPQRIDDFNPKERIAIGCRTTFPLDGEGITEDLGITGFVLIGGESFNLDWDLVRP